MKKTVTTIICLAQLSVMQAQQEIKTNVQQRAEFEHLQTQDPATGTIPRDRLYKALETISEQNNASALRTQGVQTVLQPRWLEVGPTNVGGRVRAMLMRSASTAWAGGVSGGVWRGNNVNGTSATVDWRKVNDRFGQLNITSFAVHPTNANIVYFSTGEGYYAFTNGQYPEENNLTVTMYGNGIWKTVDGGVTWNKLPCGKFRYINKMAVAHNGDLFVSAIGFPSNKIWNENKDSTGILFLKSGTFQFKKLAPINGQNYRGADIEVATDSSVYSTVGLLSKQKGSIYKSKLVGTTWVTTLVTNNAIANNDTAYSRIELACAKTNPVGKSIIYAMYSTTDGKGLKGVYKSSNGGISWTICAKPIFNIGTQFFYNMALAIHPTDTSKVLLGCENIFRSTNGGNSWDSVSVDIRNSSTFTNKTYVHPDQHDLIWYSNNVAYALNDGGIWRSDNINASAPIWENLNKNLNITQFNTCAISPSANTFNYIAGAQDNGCQYLGNAQTHGKAIEASWGDGSYVAYSTITTNGAAMKEKMITSFQNGNYYRCDSAISTASVRITNSSKGLFVNPTEVVWSNTNALIIGASAVDSIVFYPNAGTSTGLITPTYRKIIISSNGNPNSGQISFIKKSPTQANTVYLGTNYGRVYKYVYNPTTFATVALTYLNTVALPLGFVSYIDVRGATDAELIVTFSNYGVKSVWYTANATAGTATTWKALDISTQSTATGRLPDVPVWTALFAPASNSLGLSVLIGTELGVYSTTAINDSNTTAWTLDNNSPRTRITQIKYRPSDNMLLMSTYGRGLWRSDMFCTNQIWFGSTGTNYDSGCPITFADSSTGFIGIRWDIDDDGTIESTTNTVTAPCGLNQYSWIRLDKQVSATQWISLKRRGGDMFTINPNVFCVPCNTPNSTVALTPTDFVLYPNPNNGGRFNLDVHTTALTELEANVPRTVTIYNLQGQRVHTQQITTAHEVITLDTPLSNGLYIVELRTGETSTTKKITIVN